MDCASAVKIQTPPPETTKDGFKPYQVTVNGSSTRATVLLLRSPASRRRWPALARARPQYLYTSRDGQGNTFDGSKNYKVTLPPNIPATRFWSFTVYDNQHRSFLETPRRPRASKVNLHLPRRRMPTVR